MTEASLCTCQPINQCVGGPTQKLLSKSRLFTSPDDHNTLMVAAGDESSSSVSYKDITQTNWLSIFFCNTIDSFKHPFLLKFLRKLRSQGQSHKDKNTLCHNHVISMVCTLIKHSPWPIGIWDITQLLKSYIWKAHCHSKCTLNYKHLVSFNIDFNMEWKEWKSGTETTQPRKRDFRCSSICC